MTTRRLTATFVTTDAETGEEISRSSSDVVFSDFTEDVVKAAYRLMAIHGVESEGFNVPQTVD